MSPHKKNPRWITVNAPSIRVGDYIHHLSDIRGTVSVADWEVSSDVVRVVFEDGSEVHFGILNTVSIDWELSSQRQAPFLPVGSSPRTAIEAWACVPEVLT